MKNSTSLKLRRTGKLILFAVVMISCGSVLAMDPPPPTRPVPVKPSFFILAESSELFNSSFSDYICIYEGRAPIEEGSRKEIRGRIFILKNLYSNEMLKRIDLFKKKRL